MLFKNNKMYATLIIALFFSTIHVSQGNPIRDSFAKLRSLFISQKQTEIIPEQAEIIPAAPVVGLISIDQTLNSAKEIVRLLYKVAYDQAIKGLIIHMNCNGGVCGSSDLIFREIRRLKEQKPVVVFVENSCLSGGYLAACGADCIVALPSSDIGSIGVIYSLDKYKNQKFNHDGNSGDLEPHLIRLGNHKGFGYPDLPITQQEIDYFTAHCKKKYDQFIADVAQARKLDINDALLWADGRRFTGIEALALGLIDKIGDFTDALAIIQELLEKRGICGQPKILEL